MAKITENIKSLPELIKLIDDINNPEYQQANGISTEEITILKEELLKKIDEFKHEAESYINYKMKEYNEALGNAAGFKFNIERLGKLKESEDRRAENIKSWVDYLMKHFSIEKLTTNENKLSFRISDSVEIIDDERIPSEFKTTTTTTTINKTELKKAIKSLEEGKKIPGAILITKKNLQIK